MFLDPLGPLSYAAHQALKFLEALLVMALTNPTGLFNSQEGGKYAFEEVWPVSRLVAFAVVIGVLLGGALMIPATRKLIPRLGVTLAIIAGGIVPFWALTQAMNREVSLRSTRVILELGPKTALVGSPAAPYGTILPDVGEGSWQFLYYASGVAIVAVPTVYSVICVLGQTVAAAIALIGIAVYAAGEGGKEFTKTTLLLWLLSFTVAMPTVAAVYRLMQVVANVDNKFLAWILLAILATGLYWGSKKLFGFLGTKVKARLVGGDTKAKVRGNTGNRGSGPGSSHGGSGGSSSGNRNRIPVPRTSPKSQPPTGGTGSGAVRSGSKTYNGLTVGNKPSTGPKQLTPGPSGAPEKRIIIPRPVRQATTNLVIRRVSNLHPTAKTAVTAAQVINKVGKKP